MVMVFECNIREYSILDFPFLVNVQRAHFQKFLPREPDGVCDWSDLLYVLIDTADFRRQEQRINIGKLRNGSNNFVHQYNRVIFENPQIIRREEKGLI